MSDGSASGGKAREAGGSAAAIGFRPLYQQIRDVLVQRIADGRLQPGEMLPSEMQLASELGVSQGTVRKALDAMTAERLLVRRQGRGTFVAEHDETRILFQFFKLVPDDGARSFPDSEVLSVVSAAADAAERERLALAEGARVVRIRRLRRLAGVPVIVEDVVVPEAMVDGLAEMEPPNNLYGLYAGRFGVTIGRAQERLKAVALTVEDATLLGVPAGTPALEIDRLAIALDDRRAEWRLSRCLTEHVHYLSDLR
jgi:GntR family transcriptional regulator